LELEVSDLRKSFSSPAGERVEVLRGIDLTGQSGETIAITGVSGSGKSTLLQLLGGLLEPDHGTITFNKSVINSTNIGFIFQFHHLLPDLTAVENLALPLMIARKSSRVSRHKALDALQSVGLEGKGEYPVTHLSGGEQQRVAVARALINEPPLVLADEPTGNLDEAIGDEIARILLNYCRTRAALVIIATHNQKLAQDCDRILTIHGGRFNSGMRPSI
jgi:lipoprotein-releasing system ATP-binding protein